MEKNCRSNIKIISFNKSLTFIRLLAGMSSHMDNQIRGVAEGSAAVNAQMFVLIIAIVLVNLHVRS